MDNNGHRNKGLARILGLLIAYIGMGTGYALLAAVLVDALLKYIGHEVSLPVWYVVWGLVGVLSGIVYFIIRRYLPIINARNRG